MRALPQASLLTTFEFLHAPFCRAQNTRHRPQSALGAASSGSEWRLAQIQRSKEEKKTRRISEKEPILFHTEEGRRPTPRKQAGKEQRCSQRPPSPIPSGGPARNQTARPTEPPRADPSQQGSFGRRRGDPRGTPPPPTHFRVRSLPRTRRHSLQPPSVGCPAAVPTCV